MRRTCRICRRTPWRTRERTTSKGEFPHSRSMQQAQFSTKGHKQRSMHLTPVRKAKPQNMVGASGLAPADMHHDQAVQDATHINHPHCKRSAQRLHSEMVWVAHRYSSPRKAGGTQCMRSATAGKHVCPLPAAACTLWTCVSFRQTAGPQHQPTSGHLHHAPTALAEHGSAAHSS